MAEEPIKLFATRAELYPEPTASDVAHGAARAALSTIPVLGGLTTELMSVVLAPAVARRRDEWFKELADDFDRLREKVDGLFENLAENEVFVSAVIQATRTAASTHQQEKREALRNALLNIALMQSPDDDQIQMFLRYIDELTVWHLRFLQLFQQPETLLAAKNVRLDCMMGAPTVVLEAAYPELKGKRDFYDQISADLRARGMLNSSPDFLHTGMTASGMVAKRTTAIADAFLAFIKSPL